MNEASGAWGGDWGASWWRETEPVASLDFGLAATLADLDGALRLLHDRYVATGAMPPETSGRRVNVHNPLPSTKVFVAKAGSRVVATLTMVEDSRLGLPMDEVFGAELGRLRERGRRLAEAAALTIDPAYRAAGVPIMRDAAFAVHRFASTPRPRRGAVDPWIARYVAGTPRRRRALACAAITRSANARASNSDAARKVRRITGAATRRSR